MLDKIYEPLTSWSRPWEAPISGPLLTQDRSPIMGGFCMDSLRSNITANDESGLVTQRRAERTAHHQTGRPHSPAAPTNA
jgi:hypothetical protein